jgi:hypothetical protein
VPSTPSTLRPWQPRPAASHPLGVRPRADPRAARGAALGAAPASAQPPCGETITQDTTLTADLDCDDDPVVIGAPGITLDLGGHSIGGVEGYRIVNEGHDDVTIRNGTINSDGGTILLSGVSGNLVRDIDHEGLIKGWLVEDSHDNQFVHNKVNSVSWEIIRSDHNVIAHNLVTRYESALAVRDSDYNRVVDNVVWGGFGTSLILSGDHNEVRRNVFVNDSFFVVAMRDANDTHFVANTIAAGSSFWPPGGAKVEDSSRNRFLRNSLSGVPQGFALRSGADNLFRDNEIAGVPADDNPVTELVPDGLSIAAGVTGTRLRDNTVRGFDDGIDVDAPGTRLKGNTADDNGELGIEAVPGIIDLGGNSASGNGNPLQCLNVVCS